MIPDRSEEGEEKGVEAKEGDEVKEEEEEVDNGMPASNAGL